MTTLPYRAPQRPQRRATRSYNPADVIAYADQHGTAQAAQRFGIDERSVRRIRQKAEPKQETEVIPKLEELPDLVKVATFPDTADDRAGDSTWWKCPATGELMPVVPGAHRKEWEAERIAAHARHLESLSHGSNTYVKDRTLDAGHEGLGTSFQRPEVDMSAGPDMQETEAGSQETPGHVHSDAAPVGPVLSAGPLVIRERVVYRLPSEPTRKGIYDRLADIDGAMWLGPELGLIVAAILIAITWGFS